MLLFWGGNIVDNYFWYWNGLLLFGICLLIWWGYLWFLMFRFVFFLIVSMLFIVMWMWGSLWLLRLRWWRRFGSGLMWLKGKRIRIIIIIWWGLGVSLRICIRWWCLSFCWMGGCWLWGMIRGVWGFMRWRRGRRGLSLGVGWRLVWLMWGIIWGGLSSSSSSSSRVVGFWIWVCMCCWDGRVSREGGVGMGVGVVGFWSGWGGGIEVE